MRIGSISSTSNQIVKQTASLLSSKGRKEQGRFLVEGANIISNLPRNFNVRYIMCEEGKSFDSLQQHIQKHNVYTVSRAVIERVSDTVTSQGIVAVVDIPTNNFSQVQNFSRLLVLDNVSDPSNVGGILRSCSAFNVPCVLTIGGADPYSCKCVRASMGGIFFTSIFSVSLEQVLELRSEYKLICADMQGENCNSFVFPNKFALVIGSEAHGVSPMLKQSANHIVSIPISNVESLNASVAAGILLSRI